VRARAWQPHCAHLPVAGEKTRHMRTTGDQRQRSWQTRSCTMPLSTVRQLDDVHTVAEYGRSTNLQQV